MHDYRDSSANPTKYRGLSADIEQLYQVLQAHVQRRLSSSEGAPTHQNTGTLPPCAPLERLCETFSLSAFERDVLLLCAGVEVHPHFGAQCAAAQDTAIPYPTFDLVARLFPGDIKIKPNFCLTNYE
ncbi:hypothetical protein [Anthocerotibacter panamensis]|uniref:hypothetical protein n=1 Tax=Anthocerotibacter panamensis TaxID=2857077 RepID=UPI0036F24CDD